MRKFHDDHHANNRLSRCYILHKVGDEWRCGRIQSATNDKIFITGDFEYDMDDEENTSFLFPRLGYVNTRHQVCYNTRSSKRMWKVGLVPENIIREYLYPDYVTMRDDINYRDCLEDLHFNKYPSFKTCLKNVSENKKAAQAFSRDYCLGRHNKTKHVVLYYRNLPIGHYDDKEKAVVVGDVNSHYIQKLLEVVNGEVEVLV